MATKRAVSTDGVVRHPAVKNAAQKGFFKHLKKHAKKYLTVLILLVISVGGLGLRQYLVNKDITDVKIIQQKVSEHMLLPGDEQPALATVIDKTKLNKTIFKNAENGDKVLVYQKNKKMIIYRPGIDRVADVVPVAIESPGTL